MIVATLCICLCILYSSILCGNGKQKVSHRPEMRPKSYFRNLHVRSVDEPDIDPHTEPRQFYCKHLLFVDLYPPHEPRFSRCLQNLRWTRCIVAI